MLITLITNYFSCKKTKNYCNRRKRNIIIIKQVIQANLEDNYYFKLQHLQKQVIRYNKLIYNTF